MPSSYSFKNNDLPVEDGPSSSYRPNGPPSTGGGSSIPPPPLPKTNNSDNNNKINNDLSSGVVNGDEEESNKRNSSEQKDNRKSSIKSSDNNKFTDPNNLNSSRSSKLEADKGIDADAKWKASYVPAVETPDQNGTSSANGRKVSSSGDAADDERDAKWKSNYVPTSYNLGKVEILENGVGGGGGVDVVGGATKGPRCQWGSRGEGLLACLGLTVGIGNVVRFPMLAYKYGGGAFILPYVLFLVLVGMPLYFLELGIGQYAQQGPLSVWKCSSAMQGIGIAMAVLSVLTSVYYSQIMAYCLYYVFASLAYLGYELPWASCGHSWSTRGCYPITQAVALTLGNTTILSAAGAGDESAAYQYFRNQVLHQPVNVELKDDLGTIRWDLTLCLLLSWSLVFLLLVKGVKSTGRAAYILTPLPCIAMLALMITGLLMTGAQKGVLRLLVPDWSVLLAPDVWVKALEQVLFSLSVSYGGVIMLGSYNNFRNKVHIDAVGICIADLLLSLIASVAVFSVLGAMAHTLGLEDISQLPDFGHSLAFVSYPSAISSSLPLPHLCSIVFFLALFLLGLTSLAGHMHTITGGAQDMLPSLRRSPMAVAGVLCCCCFLLGLPLCAEKRGYYLFEFVSAYGIGVSVLVVSAFELITLSWLYGVRRLSQDFSFMLAYQPSMFWKLCWAFVAPVLILAALVHTIVAMALREEGLLLPPTAPLWAEYLRWTLVGASIAFIPIVFLIMFLRRLFTMKLGLLLAPSLCWGPGDPHARGQLLAARAAGGIDNPGLAY